ncbi:hypothetical protein OPQ81_000190 [Rhizoctonia solani]|nr:hypothetical protein OPQ81_000190 [Rhizoctonia solani]
MTYLEIVDTAGQDEYATLRDQWIREGEGFILVYSIASRRSYDRIKTFQDSIMRVKRGARPVFMLVGNKCDKTAEREVPKEEALSLSRVWGCPFMETSAKTAHNVERMFSDTIRSLRQARDGDNYNRPRQASGPGSGALCCFCLPTYIRRPARSLQSPTAYPSLFLSLFTTLAYPTVLLFRVLSLVFFVLLRSNSTLAQFLDY